MATGLFTIFGLDEKLSHGSSYGNRFESKNTEVGRSQITK